VSIGEALADARHQAGLTVNRVSQETRIREAIIRDIEQDDFSTCGGDFYARGHIRSIAGAVGTDPVPLISEYDAKHGPPGAIRASDVFEPSRPVKIREPHPPSLGLIVAIVLLAIIGFGAYRLVSHHHAASVSKPLAAPTHHATAAAKPSTHPSASATPPPSDDVVIKLVANEDCWVLLTKHSDGTQLYMGVVSAGHTMTWTEKQAVDMRLGNPPGIVLTVNGKRQSTNVLNPETLSFSPQSS
jgi:cytoskeletal protein RodZ